MAYCTQAQIEDRYSREDLIRYADADNDGMPDADTVSRAITDADGLIDSMLGGVFVVPIPAPIPPMVRAHAISIAWYYLQLGRDSVTDSAKKAYDDAVAWLEGVAGGTIHVGLVPLPSGSSSAPTVQYDAQPRAFGRDKAL